MNEQFKCNDSLPHVLAEQDVMALIKKMQQQLVFLEKKIDILISQSQERPFRQKFFPRPFRPFSHHRRPERGHDNTGEEKRFDRAPRFEKGYGQDKRGFGHKKESYGNSHESGFTQEQRFEKRHGQGKKGFDQKKKPFYYRQKERK